MLIGAFSIVSMTAMAGVWLRGDWRQWRPGNTRPTAPARPGRQAKHLSGFPALPAPQTRTGPTPAPSVGPTPTPEPTRVSSNQPVPVAPSSQGATDGRNEIRRARAASSGRTLRSQATPLSPPDMPSVAESPATKRDSTISACEKLGSAAQTLLCFRGLADGSGLRAETALLVMAKVQAETVGDVAAALATLGEHATRFPQGSLGIEEELFRIELLAKSADPNKALSAIEIFLFDHHDSQHAGELDFLRGHLLDTKRGDPRGAAAAFAAAAYHSPGDGNTASLRDAALFERAKCLEKSHDERAAADAWRTYLQQIRPLRREEAENRLNALVGQVVGP